MNISDILKIKPGMTALIGGGGKTTLMYKLAEELSECGTVIVCTSTKIFEPENLPMLTDGSKEAIAAALQRHRVVCAGTKIENGKLAASSVGFQELKKLADYVIVEADGAHGLPLKAHAAYEPVIPNGTNKTVLVIGADAFGQPVSQICHRPDLFAQIAEVEAGSIVTPEIVKRMIEFEQLGDCLYINKAEDEQTKAYAQKLANLLDLPVIAGSLKREEYLCLC